MSENDWSVFRQDFAGTEFIVESRLSEQRANELAEAYEAHGHHQHYWAERRPKPPTDFGKMLRELLQMGSTLEVSLGVLRNQHASTTQCIQAVREVCGLPLSEAKKCVLSSRAFANHAETQVEPRSRYRRA